MKTPNQILHDIPLDSVLKLSNSEIADIFGICKSTVSNILSDKFKDKNYTFFKPEEDERSLNCKGAWMESQERKHIKSVNIETIKNFK